MAVDGEIRGTTVVLEDGGRTTVINEPGPALDGAAWRRVLAAVGRSVIGGGAWMAVCGSVPPGVEPGAHAVLIALAYDRGRAGRRRRHRRASRRVRSGRG